MRWRRCCRARCRRRAAAVAGAVGAVALTVLYLLRLRRREVVVPFAPLWLGARRPRRTTALGRRLRHLLSLLLALALLRPGAAGGASIRGRPAADRAGRSLVILIDRSASMSARDDAGHAARGRARARATAIVDGLARRGSGAGRVVRRRRRRRERVRGRRRAACAARWPRSRPARSPAICRARWRSPPRCCAAVRARRWCWSATARSPTRPAARAPRELDVRYAAITSRSGGRAAQRRHRLVRGPARAGRSGRGRGGAGRAELRRRAGVGRGRHRGGRRHRRAACA